MSSETLTSKAQNKQLWATLLILFPALLWLAILYLGSLFGLLWQSVYRLDDYSGQVVHQIGLHTIVQLFTAANFDIVIRTTGMAIVVTIFAAILALPLAYTMVFHASKRQRAILYVAILAPMWFSYLVKVYGWRVLLSREGLIYWVLSQLGMSDLLDTILHNAPAIGGASLASSFLGMFLVFLYMWLPYMVLPIVAALERVPQNMLNASADLGATPWQTFRKITLPLTWPGIIAGGIFTFSLTLGDYIIPQVVGAPGYFIGMMVYVQQGTVGNLPLAAAFSLVPILLIMAYLSMAKRLGAFDAL
jgi:putative spermidine/putrescine transport system permease protein